VDLLLQHNNIYEACTSIKNDGRMAHREGREAEGQGKTKGGWDTERHARGMKGKAGRNLHAGGRR
jgi:hypothetical protein